MIKRDDPALHPEIDWHAVDRGKRFVEQARDDPWRANILIQLAELAGDRIPSLPGYIDRLLAVCGGEAAGAGRCTTDSGELPASTRTRYLRWFAELGVLCRGA